MTPAAVAITTAPATEAAMSRRLRRANSSDGTGTKMGFTSGSRTISIIEEHETGALDHRRSVHRQSRPGRLGLHPALRRTQEGNVRLGARNHEQPHGADGRDRGVARSQAAMRGGSDHRFGVREERHHELDSWLETQRLENQFEETGGQSGSVERT